MIMAGTYPSIGINFDRDEPGMILQYQNDERGQAKYHCPPKFTVKFRYRECIQLQQYRNPLIPLDWFQHMRRDSAQTSVV